MRVKLEHFPGESDTLTSNTLDQRVKAVALKCDWVDLFRGQGRVIELVHAMEHLPFAECSTTSW